MDAHKFADLCRTIRFIDLDQLIAAGVIPADDGHVMSATQKQWHKLNANPMEFIVKLDDDRLKALWRLLQEQNPKATMTPLQEVVDDLTHVIETLRAARVYVNVASIAAAHQSNRPVLTHTGQTIRNIDKALADLGAPQTEIEEPTNGQA